MDVAVACGFAASLAAPWVHRFTKGLTGWLLTLLPAGLFAYFASHLDTVAAGAPLTIARPWAPSLGVNLAFALDGLSLLFALLITGIGALVIIYAGAYLSGHEQLGRLYAYLLLFMASMLGLALADNALTMFVFWELTSVSSYLLIGFDHERAAARAAALQALLVTGGGGLAMLAGLVLLGQISGTHELSALAAQGEAIRSHPLYLPILLLILAGAFTKSAQVPFHFWLPNAMEAPTPVSAYLHSATMVKAGVYLLLRVSPILGGTDAWHLLVTGIGAITAAAAGYIALTQTDLKRILAYSTVSALGVLTLLAGVGSEVAIRAAMVFLLAHALYKGALFMIAGAIDHETGTREVEHLGGLWRLMPITAMAAIAAAISLAGFGPVLSFIGKEMTFEAMLAVGPGRWPLIAAAVAAGAASAGVALLVGFKPFFGSSAALPRRGHEPPLGLWLGPLGLAAGGLLLGVWPGPLARALIGPAAASAVGAQQTVKLALWHGVNWALGLSALSLTLGGLAYWGRGKLRRPSESPLFNMGPARWYDVTLQAVYRLAETQTRLLQNGYLRAYLSTIILTTVVLAGYALFGRAGFAWRIELADLQLIDVAIAALILMATWAAATSRSRLGAVAALGVVGYSVAFVFILFGAPDVAMTQFMVETLTVILLVLVFYHLPPFAQLSSRRARRRDLAIALAAGSLMTLFLLAAIGAQHAPPISDYFAENSWLLAHGRNVVNTILVDFRGLDTLGEITVLALAGVGVFALLKLRMGERGKP
jgi:multicomponent Na+:H+ antiporter subunit A